MHLDLNEGCITQLISTAHANLFQFVYVQKADFGGPLEHFIFTWDIESNLEKSMHSWKSSQQRSYAYIWRGVSERENYFIPYNENAIYDLRYSFPLNFYNGSRAHLGQSIPTYDEALFGSNLAEYQTYYK